jgi:subtilisin family serine protease
LHALIGPNCFRPGDLIMIEGRGLDASRDYSLILALPGDRMTIDVAAWQGTRLIAHLGNSPRLISGQLYRLILADRRGRPLGTSPGIQLQLCRVALNTATPLDEPQSAAAVPGEITLLLDSGGEDPENLVTGLGYVIAERVELAALSQEILRLSVPAGTSLDEAVNELRAALPGAVVDVNSLYDLQTGPRLYAKESIGWSEDAIRCAGGGQGSRIGLIDSGVDRDHPALTGQNLVLKSFLDSRKDPAPLDHATAIATLLVGDPGVGAEAGLLPHARLYVAEVFQRDGSGQTRTSTLTVAAALNWLAGENLRVVNLSFAGPQNAVLSASLSRAGRLGMILIAASGNYGPDAPPAYPAADSSVIAVTAVDSENRLYARANRGKHIDFAAPGVDVWTARTGGSGVYRSGTSFASPYVAAIAAMELTRNPRLSAGLLKEGIRRSALDLGPDGKDPDFGWGLVRAHCDD